MTSLGPAQASNEDGRQALPWEPDTVGRGVRVEPRLVKTVEDEISISGRRHNRGKRTVKEPVRRRLPRGAVFGGHVPVVGDLQRVHPREIAGLLDQPRRRRIVETRMEHSEDESSIGPEQAPGCAQQGVDLRQIHEDHRRDDRIEVLFSESQQCGLISGIDNSRVDLIAIRVATGKVQERVARIGGNDPRPEPGHLPGDDAISASDLQPQEMSSSTG